MIDQTPHSPLLSGEQAARYLLLTKPDANGERTQAGIRKLYALVRAGKLRPLAESHPYVFWIDELERYIRDDTEAFTPQQRRRSDT